MEAVESMGWDRREILVNLLPFVYAYMVVLLNRFFAATEVNSDISEAFSLFGLIVIGFRWFFAKFSANLSESGIVVRGGFWATLERRDIPTAAFYILGIFLLLIGTLPLIDRGVVATFHVRPPYTHIQRSDEAPTENDPKKGPGRPSDYKADE